MSYNIKAFQSRYSLANKDIAQICKCSLPTIQKWRSGEVQVSGAAEQLMRLLDISADGNPNALRENLSKINQPVDSSGSPVDSEIKNLESSMTKVVDRLEYMLENRRRDSELAVSETRYRSMVESYSNPVCRWLPDTMLTFANDAYRKIFFKDEQDIVGRKWIEFLPEEIQESTMILVSDMIRRGEEETSTHEVLKADGSVAIYEWQDIPIKDSVGKITELHSIGYEVTELIELRAMKDSCTLTKQAFFDLSTDAMVLMNGDGVFLDANRVFKNAIIGDASIKGMADLLSGPAVGKLKRLLKRIEPRDVFNYQLKINHRAYRMNGRLIAGNSKDEACYLTRFDEISTLENQITQLRLGTEFVFDGSTRELNWSDETKSTIQNSINQAGKALNVDRVFVFTIDQEENVFNNILEWCANGVQSFIDDLQGFPVSEYPWWMERILKNQWIKFEDTSKMPRGAFRERDILVAQGIRSIIAAPLCVEESVIGWVGFNHTQRIWHAQDQKSLENLKRELESAIVAELE